MESPSLQACPGLREARRGHGWQSCSAQRLPSCGASVPLAAVGQASACHASTRSTRLGVTPYRLAGHSLRPSWASLTRMCLRRRERLRLGIHACAGHIRRLNGRGNPSPHQLVGVRAGGPGEYRPTAVGQGKMARCHVSREAAHIRRLNGRGNPSSPPPE
jgi:hypothetical protein